MEDNLIEKDLGGNRAGRMTVRGGLTEFPTFDDEDQDILNMIGTVKEEGEPKIEEGQQPKDIQSQIDTDHKVENKRSVMPAVVEDQVQTKKNSGEKVVAAKIQESSEFHFEALKSNIIDEDENPFNYANLPVQDRASRRRSSFAGTGFEKLAQTEEEET